MKTLKFVLTISAVIVAPSRLRGNADPIVMNFNQLICLPGDTVLGRVPALYEEDGFVLTAPNSALRFPCPETSLYPASTAVFNEYKDGVTVLRATGDRVFSMQSVAITLLTGNADVTSHFAGKTPLGDIVTVDFTRSRSSPFSFVTDHILTTELFPPSFSQVVEVSWVDTPSNQLGNAMLIDDLTMTIVPEPSSVLMITLGSAGLFLRRRIGLKRRRS